MLLAMHVEGLLPAVLPLVQNQQEQVDVQQQQQDQEQLQQKQDACADEPAEDPALLFFDALQMIGSLSAAVTGLGPQLTAMQQQAPAAVPDVVPKPRDPLPSLLQQQESLSQAIDLVIGTEALGNGRSDSSGSVDTTSSSSRSSNWYDVICRCAAPDAYTALQLLPMLKAAVSAELAQQLVDFAAALSGCFPAKLCCNAPGCSSLANRSELEAVSGKSCMCGRCKTAR
jgi:hypothetical protein